jgi:rod shape-determining protein MreB
LLFENRLMIAGVAKMNSPTFIDNLVPVAASIWPGLRLLFATDLAIDLGAANTRIFVPGRGVTLNEPSVIALSEVNNETVAVGHAANTMIGRGPASVRVVHPLRDGVIADIGAATKMLATFINRAVTRPTLLRPHLLLCIPAETTSLERRALKEVARGVGARRVNFIEEPVAAAVGVGITSSPHATAIVDIGAETVNVAVLSARGLIHAATSRTGGRAMDRAITDHLRRRHHLEIGGETAEMIKLRLGSTSPRQVIEVTGRSIKKLRPARVSVTSDEIQMALKPAVSEIVRSVIKALENLPAEVAADLYKSGLTLTGGAAQLPGLAEKLGERIGLAAHIAANPMFAAVIGAARVLWPESLKAEAWRLFEPAMSNPAAISD